MTPAEREALERDGWQLLLWSYRHELGLDQTHTTRAGDLDDGGEFHRTRDGQAWHPDDKLATGELAEDRAEWVARIRAGDKWQEYDDPAPPPPV